MILHSDITNNKVKSGLYIVSTPIGIDKCDRTSKWSWSTDGKEALEELSTRLGDCKRRYTNPDNILAYGSSLATLGDADPEAIVCSLWIIQQHDANDIRPKDFYEDSTVLLGMHPKTLNKAQQRWHISEKELLAIVYAIERFGEFIDRVIASWFLAQDQTKCQWIRGQLIPDVPKIAICSDSSSALGMLLRLSCPSGRIEHVTPKITRFMTYVDTCACTLFWPLARMLIPGAGDGPCNSLCDYMCRIVGALKRLQDTQVNEDEFFEDMPFDHVLAMSIGDYVAITLPQDLKRWN